uniref:glutathione transferase n=1 Tax=Pinus tabuliformis TaxID=88731 RepID=L7S0Y8_PINTB|nr:tau class glutathione S-transferase [Pinus tabuliformis]
MEGCGEEEQVKLLGAAVSPFTARVRMALALKGIHYEFIEEDIHNRSELLLKSNPVHKKIPVLIHSGKSVCESMIIVQYIEEAWGNKAPNLMPKDPYDRAIARFWVAFIEDKFAQSVLGVFNGQGEQQQKAAEESVANFLLLEEALSGKAYFGGDEIGLVDISLGGLLVFIKMLEKVTNLVLIDAERMPVLSAWVDRFSEADGVKDVLPDRAKIFEFISGWRAKLT